MDSNQRDGGGGKRNKNTADGYAEALAEGKFELRYLIPSKCAGAIIGRGGEKIKTIRDKARSIILISVVGLDLITVKNSRLSFKIDVSCADTLILLTNRPYFSITRPSVCQINQVPNGNSSFHNVHTNSPNLLRRFLCSHQDLSGMLSQSSITHRIPSKNSLFDTFLTNLF